MKIKSYSICEPSRYSKTHHILGTDVDSNNSRPIIYFLKPKWIKDEAVWETIVNSVTLDLPQSFEIK